MTAMTDSIEAFKHRLFLVYTTALSAILTLLFVGVWLYQSHLGAVQQKSEFQNYLLELSSKLESDFYFSDNWLAVMESNNQLIIHIEENGIPFLFSGSWTPAVSREELVDSVKKEAKKEGLSLSEKPLTGTTSHSSFFTLHENSHTFYAVAWILSGNSSYKSLVLLQDITASKQRLFFEGLFFFVADIFAIFLIAFFNHSMLKKATQPVLEYQKRQNQFVSSASHELRSPFSVIQSSISLLEEEPNRLSSIASTIKKECTRAGKLIQNLLFLASADSGTAVRPLISVEADEILLQIYESYESLCRYKGISLRLTLPEEFLPNVLSVPDYLYQLLTIFLDNAIAYGCSLSAASALSPPLIELNACKKNNHVVLAVIDHGCGIPKEKREQIFERFYQSDSSHNQKEHFGLGLSIAKQLAPLANASLNVTETPGGGATFLIQLQKI